MHGLSSTLANLIKGPHVSLSHLGHLWEKGNCNPLLVNLRQVEIVLSLHYKFLKMGVGEVGLHK